MANCWTATFLVVRPETSDLPQIQPTCNRPRALDLHDPGYGSKLHHQGLEVLVLASICEGKPFWGRATFLFDPSPPQEIFSRISGAPGPGQAQKKKPTLDWAKLPPAPWRWHDSCSLRCWDWPAEFCRELIIDPT